MALEDKNIDEQMAADWSAIRDKFKVEEPETPEPAAEPEAPAQESVVETPERARDDSGRFTKAAESSKNAEPVGQKPAPTEAPAQEPAAEPVVSVKGTPVDLTRAPSSWKPAARAEFAKLPEAIRAEIHRRESESAAGVHQLMPDAQLGKSMREVAAPYKALIDAEANGKPELAFAELIKTASILRMGTPQQKRDVVLGVARQYGVDLGLQPQQQPVQGQPPQQTFQDPRVDQLLQHLQTQEQQRQQQEQQALENTVTQWMEAKDEAGNPKYPYLGDVMNDMAVIVPQIRQSSPSLSHEQVLQSAYERAIWANPDVRPLLLQAQAAPPAREAANQTRVREAKRAASVNVPRRASQPAPAKPGRMEETIEATARELGLIS